MPKGMGEWGGGRKKVLKPMVPVGIEPAAISKTKCLW
jgi:hypothetical protein